MILAQQRFGGTNYATPMDKLGGMRNKWSSLLETLADLEGNAFARNEPKHIPLDDPSGSLTIKSSESRTCQDFASGAGASRSCHSSFDYAVEHGSLVGSEWTTDPEPLVDCTYPAELLPTYNRHGAAV